MIDRKIITLLTLVNVGNYTQTAKVLSLTQPAVTNHIKQLEEEFGIKIFYKNKRELKLTLEGEILIEYAKKAVSLSDKAQRAIDDHKKSIKRFTVGITQTLGEYLISPIFARYCNEHPDVHINIITDNAKNIYNKLSTYELDWAIVEDSIPNKDYTSILLDTDYLCLVVSPKHKFANRKSVELYELKQERFILRSRNAGTRLLFENHLLRHSENIRNFNIIIEIDNITAIKELVASNLGVTIMSYSACRDEEAAGKLLVVPIKNFNMVREINMVYHKDFKHTEILKDIRQIYAQSKSTGA